MKKTRQTVITDTFGVRRGPTHAKPYWRSAKTKQIEFSFRSRQCPSSPTLLELVELDVGRVQKLREFDLDVRYGPCIGISRLERWIRANELGLDPPEELLDWLTDEQMRQRTGARLLDRCFWSKIFE